MTKVLFAIGARPNFPKVAPILAALAPGCGIDPVLVHTGQHHDPSLSDVFFEDLQLPLPHRSMAIASGPRSQRLEAMTRRLIRVCKEEQPDAVVVVGDVDSTLACTLAAAQRNIPIAHVEAGLRSRDRSMPEELNRLQVDHLSNRLYTHCADADRNLAAEGIDPALVRQVGNTMVDSLLRFRGRATQPAFAAPLGLRDRGYALVTLHRPALVDDPQRLAAMLDALQKLSADLPVVFPLHPRTRQRLDDLGRLPDGRLYPTPPIRYLEFLHLMDHARMVLTDSGGIQEETTALAVPCLTVRDNTERPVTLEAGTNQLVGLDPKRMLAAARKALSRRFPSPLPPIPGWDGRAGERIAADLPQWLAGS